MAGRWLTVLCCLVAAACVGAGEPAWHDGFERRALAEYLLGPAPPASACCRSGRMAAWRSAWRRARRRWSSQR